MEKNLIPVLEILRKSLHLKDKIAISDGNCEIKYNQLSQKINFLSSYINQFFVGKNNKRAAILSDGSAELVLSILSVQFVSGAYVPIEPKLPNNRIKAIFDTANPSIIISDIKNKLRCEEISLLTGIPYLLIVDITDEIIISNVDVDNNNLPIDIVSDELTPAVVFFTSGSTGKPKGVELSHRGYFRWYEGISSIFELCDNEKIALTTNHSFDLSIGEIYLGLLSGSTLHVANQDIVRDPFSIIGWLQSNNITIWQSVPSLMRQILSFKHKNNKLDHLKYLMFCGEPLELSLIRKLKNNLSTEAKIINLYGPVEASVQVAYCWVDEYINDDSLTIVPLGKPLKHACLHHSSNVHDESEIRISGEHLALGYLDNDKTKESFILDPSTNDIQYKTGDIGRMNNNGDLEYVCRIDDQIKINGYRIEVSEIEKIILEHTSVHEVCVVPHKTEVSHEIHAFIVGDEDGSSIKTKISKFLPIYMIPRKIFKIKNIPLTTNGKRDKVKLIKEYLS